MSLEVVLGRSDHLDGCELVAVEDMDVSLEGDVYVMTTSGEEIWLTRGSRNE